MPNHKYLMLSAALLVMIMTGILSGCVTGSFVSEIEPKEAYQMIKKEDPLNLIVLDVRTREEFQHGRIPDAINIDFYKSDFEENVAKLSRDKVYIVYCLTSQRSSEAAQVMRKLGFKKIYNLRGGIMKWNSERLPIER